MKRHICFIVNPFSGTSLKNNFAKLVEQNLDLDLFDYEVVFTEHPEHAKEIAKNALHLKRDIVAVVGGDGTVNEVASTLVNTEVPLAVFPGGSGNGFAMHLGIGRNMKRALKLLSRCQEVLIDTCEANNKFFINIAGVGFDAMVANISKKDSARGLWLYVRHTLLKAFSYEEKKLKVHIDDMYFEEEFLTISAANGSMFGYNFRIAPKALLTDGYLDIVLIRKAPIWRYMISFWRFLNRTAEKLDFVDYINCKKLTISSEEEVYFHLDGEGLGKLTHLEVEIKPASLKVFVPDFMLK